MDVSPLEVAGKPSLHAAESLFTAKPPAVDVELARRIALEHYGIAGEATKLHSERDTNFLVSAGESSFILKITNQEEPAGVTDFQTEALLHMERSAPGLPVPHLKRTLDGKASTFVELSTGKSAVRLLTYLNGSPLKELQRSRFPYSQIGQVIAELGKVLEGFDHPYKKYDLVWDSSSLQNLKPLLGFVTDPALFALCEKIVADFEQRVGPRLAGLNWQVIHNDINLNNILVSPDDGSVAGIFDFGDMVYAPRVNELAVTCTYHVAEGDLFKPRLTALVSAYNEVIPLTEGELSALYDLILARFVTTILITYWRASIFPENRTYILRNNPTAVEGLRLLTSLGNDASHRLFRAACHLE
ncbi:phosphotransferase [Gemmobacter fulvus]|uniref:phosphotransferase n=1 Tax=Gemmobacter fulvus TaxID=2840474 RepID=UPI002796403E|nr:phosphotransferase [Gemmobacter fulvus]MDQ1850618.1 phosphotransferase [Gemmobacter fulvus]